MLTIAKRIIKQILHDRRSLGVMVLAPILLITLMYFLLGNTDYRPKVELDKRKANLVMGSILADNLANELNKDKTIIFSSLTEKTDINNHVENSNVDAVITFEGQDLKIVMLDLVSQKVKIVTDSIKAASNSLSLNNEKTITFLSETELPQLQQVQTLFKADYIPKIGVFSGTMPESFVKSLSNNNTIQLIIIPENVNLKTFIQEGNTDAVIDFSIDKFNIIMSRNNPFISAKINSAIQIAMSEIKIGKNSEVDFIFGSSDESTFDSLAYYLLGVLSFFLIFIFSGVSFVRERTGGTLERLMRTPIRSFEVVFGYMLGFGFFAVLQSILVILYSKFVLNTLFIGNWILAMIIMILTAIIAVMLGMFVSVLSQNEFQVVQAIPLLIVPQIFFAGLIPVDMLPLHLDIVSYFLPLFYSGTALKYIMIYGYKIDKILPHIGILWGFIIFLFLINTIAVNKTRRV